MGGMTISIAMATFNGERYLDKQLDSILHQTRWPDEVVVADDCSTDATMALLNKFANDAPFPVRVYQNSSNLGLVRNFERAIGLCRGDLIFLADQDDVWLPAKVAVVADAFVTPAKPLVVVHDAELIDWQGRSFGITKAAQTRAAGASADQMVTGCCTAFRQEFASVVLPILDAFGNHDDWLHMLARPLGRSIFLPEVLQLYRRHDRNVSHSLTSRTKPITRIERAIARLRRIGGGDSTKAKLCRYIEQHQVMLGRFAECRPILTDLMEDAEFEGIVAMLKRRHDLAVFRHNILEQSRLRRAAGVAKLVRMGGYDNLGGWKSALKDCVL